MNGRLYEKINGVFSGFAGRNNYRMRRKIKGRLMFFLSFLAAFVGVTCLFSILYSLIKTGLAGMSLALFTDDAAPPWLENEGGMRHAFIGQLILTGVGSLIGIPVGVLGGVYLAEYGNRSRFGKIVSGLADVSVSVPTIIVGTFVYSFLVQPFGGFNGWAGAIALAIIILPLVMRTTEDALRLIPWTMREAAFALGAPYYKVIKDVVLKSAFSAVFTGVSLAVSRIAGETAPVLFTSFNNNYLSADMSAPMPSLTVTVFQYAGSPYEKWVLSAWASALVMTVFILLLNVILKRMMKRRKFS